MYFFLFLVVFGRFEMGGGGGEKGWVVGDNTVLGGGKFILFGLRMEIFYFRCRGLGVNGYSGILDSI